MQDMIGNNIEIILVSNRSFYPASKVDSSTWVITSSIDLYYSIFRGNIILGNSEIHCSHKSELDGIIGRL